MAFLQAQTQSSYALAGAGVVAGATSVILKSFQTIDGANLTMADFGSIGYATLEPGNSSQEEQISFSGVVQNANGTATLTGVKTVLFVSPYTETSGLAKTHPGSSSCVISNTAAFYEQYGHLQNDDVITGYWEAPDPLTAQGLVTRDYMLALINGGTITTNAVVVLADAGENVSDGDWVYLKVSDGLWYKTDATDTSKCLGVQIGKARGAGMAGNTITGGVFILPVENVATYVAGTTYYLSDTPGALSTSAGTNSVVVGVGDGNGALVLRKPTPSQTDAMQGGGDLGTPSDANKFVTEDYLVASSTLPVTRLYGERSGDTTTQFDVTNPSGTTFRYTFDGTGTDPNITALTAPVGYKVNITGTAFTAANRGTFTITGSGANYFEVTNASGVAETNKTLTQGYLQIYNPTWSKPTGLKYITVEVVGGGASGGSANSAGGEAGGGGGGGYSKETIVASALGATETITVGLGGISVSNGTGTTGGTTSFGTSPLLQATGGAGGTTSNGGVGGVGSGGAINISGDGGGSVIGTTANGYGGGSFYGATTIGASGDTGVSGSGYGGGGSGGGTSSGTGAPGVVIVTEYFI